MPNLRMITHYAGIDPFRMVRTLRRLSPFVRDYREWRRTNDRAAFPHARLFPCLDDRWGGAGDASGAYFHQDLHVARRIFETVPRRHIDIGSRIDGFVAHVAVFRPIEVVDIRPLSSTARNIAFRQCDLMQPLSAGDIACCDSLSCLHALEHFGLGRYGDPVDPGGHAKALTNLIAMLEPGGRLFLSVPIGPQRVEFNAQRVFLPRHVVELVGERMQLDRFAYVDDAGDLHEACDTQELKSGGTYGCQCGTGIFEFVKPAHG